MFKRFLENHSLKNEDLKNLYLLIHQNGPIKKMDLMEKTHIKKTTLVRMMDELIKQKYIKEIGFGEALVGRPPILYDIEPDCNYMIGIHISRMKTTIMLLDLRFNPIDQLSFVMTPIHTPEFVMMKIDSTIKRFMETHHFDERKLLGIGVAMIGPINQMEGVILKPESSLLAGWENVRIVDMIREKYPVKVIVEKSANAAVAAEHHAANYVYENILYCISGGWGMDCGIINNGNILRNNDVHGSSYGHMIIDVDGRVCSCGKRGCIVAYTSFKGIIEELYKEKALHGMMKEELFEQASLSEMMEFFVQGDEKMKNIILKSSCYLGIGISNLVNIFNPDLVVLSGPFMFEFDEYYKQTVKSAKENSMNKREIKYSQGALKENAASIGAAILLFNTYFSK
ncbi:ROK family protein [Bacillus sp. 1P06AnD]|uniref:ROK family protein n=1 Tax=Bacillus sp. 1P06AnD TaxID=3132208 RepID=UPI0039A34B05